MKLFEGIIPALVTAFDKNEEVNYKAVGQMTERLIEQGVGGLFICGSTGEWWSLTAAERMRIADTVVEAARGRTKIMVHVGANSTREATSLARHAEKAGAHAVSALPPVGRPYAPKLIWDHFKAIGAASSLPMYLYHLPQVYGDLITIDKFVEAIDTMPTLAGAKFSSYRIDELIDLRLKAKGKLNILSGCGEQLLSATINGADGSICTWYNVIPRLGNKIIELARKGDMAAASKHQDLLVAFAMVMLSNGMGNAKALIGLRGIDVGMPRRPLGGTPVEEMKKLMPKLEATGIMEWVI